jgi:two-component system, NtrC family, response regulator PilR
MDRILRHRWPGNVRELENLMERAVALETTAVILAERLPVGFGSNIGDGRAEIGEGFCLDEHLDGLEGRLLQDALARAGGDRQEAARLLGIKPRSLRYLMQKHAGLLTRAERGRASQGLR